MRCAICHRESGEFNYCKFHVKAHENIMTRYEQWNAALNISWKEYLSEIAKNPLSGEWVKEVAQHLMSDRGRTYVKKRQEKRL